MLSFEEFLEPDASNDCFQSRKTSTYTAAAPVGSCSQYHRLRSEELSAAVPVSHTIYQGFVRFCVNESWAIAMMHATFTQEGAKTSKPQMGVS